MLNGDVLGIIGFENTKWVVGGLVFGILLSAVYFFILELTLKWAFGFTPKWGKFLVMIIHYLKLVLLAGILYLVLRLAGFALALGIILGIMAWQLIWLVKNVKKNIP
ncbi:MAG: hypothetical protein WA118_03320 [Carboxydocellales bacterium]